MDIQSVLTIVVLLFAIVTSSGGVFWKLVKVAKRVDAVLEFYEGRQCDVHTDRLDDHEKRITKLEE